MVFTPFCCARFEDVLADLGGIVGAKDVSAAGFGVGGKAIGQLVEMGSRIAFTLGNLHPYGFEVNALVRFLAADAIGLGEAAQRSREVWIVQGRVDGVAKFLTHQFTPAASSTKTMISFSGPCTPMVRTRSISAVRLGPVIKEM